MFPFVSIKEMTVTCGVRQALLEHVGVCHVFFSEDWVVPVVELGVVGFIQVSLQNGTMTRINVYP
jgi:hypothetical protein